MSYLFVDYTEGIDLKTFLGTVRVSNLYVTMVACRIVNHGRLIPGFVYGFYMSKTCVETAKTTHELRIKQCTGARPGSRVLQPRRFVYVSQTIGT